MHALDPLNSENLISEAFVLVSKVPAMTIPPDPIEGVTADVKEMDMQDMTAKDDVYNIELNWLAFNWRVLHMAAEVGSSLV